MELYTNLNNDLQIIEDFFVDEDDKMYSVIGLNSSKLESTVKDLIK